MLAVVVATAAVTLAIGVTTAALTGYLAPRGKATPQTTLVAPTANAGKAAATAKQDPPRSIVLVPVTEDAPRPKRGRAIAPRRPAPILAAEHDDEREQEHERVATAYDSGEHEDDDD
jgi:hypothetical protein